MATPGNFVAGVALTAAEMNLLPGGCVGVHQLTTAFVTVSTHTTYQDEGLTLTLTPPGGRRWQFMLSVNPYVSGGANTVTFQLLAGATTLREWSIQAGALSTTTAMSVTLLHTQILTALGSTVFKIQMKGTSNTAVNSFGSATLIRQLVVQDIGPV